MSREIKFRAWDTELQRYWYDILNIGTGGRPEFDCGDDYFNDERFVIEQYTGLKDKNGKKIYEGDIVTLSGEWEELEADDCHIVTFKDGCFRIGDGYENEVGSYLSDWRVVGNIHANPELLGDNK